MVFDGEDDEEFRLALIEDDDKSSHANMSQRKSNISMPRSSMREDPDKFKLHLDGFEIQ
jgi:hypothetical protein